MIDPKDPKDLPSPFEPHEVEQEDHDAEREEDEGEPFDGNFA